MTPSCYLAWCENEAEFWVAPDFLQGVVPALPICSRCFVFGNGLGAGLEIVGKVGSSDPSHTITGP